MIVVDATANEFMFLYHRRRTNIFYIKSGQLFILVVPGGSEASDFVNRQLAYQLVYQCCFPNMQIACEKILLPIMLLRF